MDWGPFGCLYHLQLLATQFCKLWATACMLEAVFLCALLGILDGACIHTLFSLMHGGSAHDMDYDGLTLLRHSQGFSRWLNPVDTPFLE